MIWLVGIGLAAGVASALLFAAILSASLLSIPLFYLAPLPIMIAALGWGHLTGLLATAAASASLAFAFGGFLFLAFLIGVGLPAWWLSYLALLAKVEPGEDPAQLQWYPVGRVVVWAALLAGLVIAIAIPNIGSDVESFRSTLRATFERVLQLQRGGGARDGGATASSGAAAVEFLTLILPATAGVLAMLTHLFSLWLGARAVAISGLLRRPWPDIPALALPPSVWIILPVAIFAMFLPGLAGVMAGVFAATLLTACALVGLGVMHTLTRALNGRGFVLGGLYAGIFLLGWPLLLMSVLGALDAALDLRGRAARRGPPAVPE